MYTYSLISNSTNILRSDGATIPADAGNTDYQAYLTWLAAGNTPSYVSPPPMTLAHQAAAMLAKGINITSTGTPSLNGLYLTNAAAQANANYVANYVSINGKFPGATPSTTFTWLDSSNNPHVFPSTTEFMAFYTAAADFVADCQTIILTNTGTLPSSSVNIP